MNKKRSNEGHSWRFFRAGGFDQVRIDSGGDLRELYQLDQKLWVALACPIDNVHFDARTLSLIDSDGDRRIRAAELIAAIRWIVPLLKNPDDLVGTDRAFTLHALSDATDDGRKMIAATRDALAVLGKKETDALTVADIESLEKLLSQRAFNGDGVITEEAAPDDATRGVIKEIIAALGSVTDRSGKPGVTGGKIEDFFAKAAEYESWYARLQSDPSLRPLGDATEAAVRAIAAVRDKIDDYFTRCVIAGFDERALAVLNGGEKPFETLGGNKPLSTHCGELALLPLARVKPRAPLPLTGELNPAWADAMKEFEIAAVRPIFGEKVVIDESEWRRILAVVSPVFAWYERKPGNLFDAAGRERVRELVGGAACPTLRGLVERDKEQSATFESLSGLEKAARFHRDLHSLTVNFVNFKDFYSQGGAAIFQAGTLFLDQRSCRLCIKVDDPNKHGLMAAMAGAYCAYCECRRRGAGGEKMNIVAAFTNGDSDNLIPGRNGVFYDRAGNDWDATIVKIIENPISLRQAFWLPYKGLVRMIETQVAKRAMAAEAQSTSKLQQTAIAAAHADVAKVAPEPPPKKLDIGIVAALGVAAGALGTFVATLLGYASGIVRLGPFAVVGALLGLLLLISGPSLVLAYIKLRKRNLGPILDASGWAVNATARINVPFGAALTHMPALPPGSRRDLIDPYAQKRSPWPAIAAIALLLYGAYLALNRLGLVNEWTAGHFGKKKGTEQTIGIETKKASVVEPKGRN